MIHRRTFIASSLAIALPRIEADARAEAPRQESARRRRFCEDFAQQRWRDLAASAAAVGKLRQSDRGHFGGLVHAVTVNFGLNDERPSRTANAGT